MPGMGSAAQQGAAAMTITRVLYNIMTDDLAGTRDFYERLLGMVPIYDSSWYVVLKPSETSAHELGIIDVNSEVVPQSFRGRPTSGSYLTFVVDDVEKIFRRAKSQKLNVLEAPQDLFYGQRRMLVLDPNGLLIDISSPVAG
jgi:catechol 2,3-dioxygenase-like lactoylglutathione lyase family enzyme